MRKAKKDSGFTLIELSMVVVIIGLIVGGVLVGNELIEAAKARGAMSEVDQIQTAAHTFRLKYNGLPGDIRDADKLGLPKIVSGFGANGNGNRLIESHANTGYQAGEVILFWRHLKAARLFDSSVDETLTDSCAPNISPNPNIEQFKQYYPYSKALSNGASWIAFPGYSEASDSTWGTGPTHGGSLSGKNYLFLAVPYYHSTCQMVINSAWTNAFHPRVAAYIDSKMDDGLPESGKVMIVHNTGAQGYKYGLPNHYTTTACLINSTTYNLNNYNPTASGNWDRAGCTLRIQTNY